MHCPSDQMLCGECASALAALRPAAEQEGRHLAELLASHVLPDQPWLDTLDAKSAAIRKRVSVLTSDRRLIGELAAICVVAARARWEQLRQRRSPRD